MGLAQQASVANDQVFSLQWEGGAYQRESGSAFLHLEAA
jgi:hypothetical protein